MPEVVEVALTALFLNDMLKNKKITKINIIGGRYSRHPLQGLSTLIKVTPLTVTRVNSKGKFMWFELTDSSDKKYYIMNTFGLEGNWTFDSKTHSNVSFGLSNNKTLYFNDSRNFGTLVFTSSKSKLDEKINDLGPDFLKLSFTDTEFHKRIQDYMTNKNGTISEPRKNKKIVQVLMEQSSDKGLGSGIGNYLVAEILYDARMSPHKTINEIYDDKGLSDALSGSIKRVIKLSFYTANVGYMEHLNNDMDQFVIKFRKDNKDLYHKLTKIGKDKFTFKVYGMNKKKDPKGNPIKAEKDIIKGRTTYWSPVLQK
jgi:formamidopyrimidine-DNA glycosylase